MLAENKKHFRPDIEGLRAVAILLVIGAHYSAPGMSAGFIGVDMFFVISGFLITGILLRERESTGGVNLTRFYANRMRRLLPALAVMLAVSAGLALACLSPEEQEQSSLVGIMATLWASNLYFAFSTIDYFGANQQENLFLHAWSLGVEEQFYLIWPALLLIGVRFASHKKRG